MHIIASDGFLSVKWGDFNEFLNAKWGDYCYIFNGFLSAK